MNISAILEKIDENQLFVRTFHRETDLPTWTVKGVILGGSDQPLRLK